MRVSNTFNLFWAATGKLCQYNITKDIILFWYLLLVSCKNHLSIKQISVG